ncbi:MAG: DNA-binding protein [Actinomycetota bacterium]|nr:DNA-binding protein [Actinomycetota bacterium]
MATTRVQLCGRVTVELAGRRIENELPGRQGRLLFVFLAANRARELRRDELVDALWPRAAPANVDAAVSALLSKLRRVVGPDRLDGRGAVRLVLPEDGWVDLEAATEALHRAESALAREQWPAAWGPARVTQHIAARGFLPGEDAPWIAAVRDRLENAYVRSLEIVAHASLHLGGTELDTAERSARTLVERAPYRETGYRYLMEVVDRRGNRAEALRIYDDLRRRLRDDLGAAPSPATQDMHRRLLG